PAHYEATLMRASGTPILDLKRPQALGAKAQRRLLDTLREYNAEHHALRPDNSALSARVASYELAYRMQSAAPEAVDLSREADRKQRGLLDSTLVVWGGEFGRQPTAEYAVGTGRDHNAYGFTMWLAGGGVKGGVSVGATDELGSRAVEKPFHVKHLHATILDRLGLDPDRLTYFYGGLDQKLVGVEGADPIRELLA